MSFENFLQFWSAYNRQIIEFVFVSTFVLILFVIYRQFFSKAETAGAGDAHATPVSIDTSEIEEKLKKILENQGAFRAASVEPGISSGSSKTASSGSSAVVVDNQELEKLRSEIKEKEKAIEELKKIATAAPSGTGAAASAADTKKLDDKIKELEGRLQEYEIISEDIADLSFYKEENARLQKELGSKSVAPVSVEPVAPAPVVPPPVVAAPAAPVVAATPAPPAAVPTPVVSSTETAPGAMDSVIDDDILKEFAAAVEGQKAAEAPKTVAVESPVVAEAAPPPTGEPPQPVDPQKLNESKELMGEFENFIKKG